METLKKKSIYFYQYAKLTIYYIHTLSLYTGLIIFIK